MDTAQWPQEILVKAPTMEEMIPNTCSSSATTCSNIISSNNITNNNTTTTTNNNNIITNNSNTKPSSTSLERKVKPQKDQAVNCPRCNSTNTKFCYYNNYSLTQPRYFCKTCRRYWTEGGSLRNIPVGGGSRKNKRSSSSSSSSGISKKLSSSHDLVATSQSHHHQHQQSYGSQNPKFHHHHQQGGQDLNLGFPQNHQQQQTEFRSLSEFMQLPTIDSSNTHKGQIGNSGGGNTGGSNGAAHHHLSALELLNGLTSSRGLTPFMPMPVSDPNGVYSSGFAMQEYKPSLNFSLVDGLGNGYGSLQGHEVHQTSDTNNNNSGRLLFPFEDLKQVSSNTSADHNNNNNNSGDNTHEQQQNGGEQGDSTPGFWSGMLGNAGSW